MPVMRITSRLAISLLAIAMTTGVVGCASQQDDVLARSESEATGWPGVNLDGKDPLQVAAGRDVAEKQCASCHAIDRTSASPNRSAPPLRDVLAVNDPDRLAYRFIDAMRVGHDEMPLFDFDVRSADALIAFIQSISGPSD